MSETYLTNMDNYTNTPLHDTLQTLFMRKVGKLIHLATQTRPDILYAMTQLLRRNKKASRRDMLAVDRVLHYILVQATWDRLTAAGDYHQNYTRP